MFVEIFFTSVENRLKPFNNIAFKFRVLKTIKECSFHFLCLMLTKHTFEKNEKRKNIENRNK